MARRLPLAKARHNVVLLALAALLAGCAGIPLSTVARMATFKPETLLDADPAELRVALDFDARMRAVFAQVPELLVSVKPADAGTFVPIDRNIPFGLDDGDPAKLGLAPARPGRQWLVYRLDPRGATALREVQQLMRALRDAKPKPHRGVLRIEVKLDGVGDAFPELHDTHLESWLRITAADGFFKLWSGRVGDTGRRS
jgi:hypothetical protein